MGSSQSVSVLSDSDHRGKNHITLSEFLEEESNCRLWQRDLERNYIIHFSGVVLDCCTDSKINTISQTGMFGASFSSCLQVFSALKEGNLAFGQVHNAEDIGLHEEVRHLQCMSSGKGSSASIF